MKSLLLISNAPVFVPLTEHIVQEHIHHYLDNNPQFLEDYVVKNVPVDQAEKWVTSIRKKPKPTSAVRSPREQAQATRKLHVQTSMGPASISGPLSPKSDISFSGRCMPIARYLTSNVPHAHKLAHAGMPSSHICAIVTQSLSCSL